jgi:hypothetical protein
MAQQQQSDAPSAAECQEMFNAADIDNDGILSRDELASSEDSATSIKLTKVSPTCPRANFCRTAPANRLVAFAD